MKLLNKRQQDTYLRLIQELPLVSIASKKHLDAAQAMIDRLTDKKKLDGGEQAYLNALCDLSSCMRISIIRSQTPRMPICSAI